MYSITPDTRYQNNHKDETADTGHNKGHDGVVNDDDDDDDDHDDNDNRFENGTFMFEYNMQYEDDATSSPEDQV